MKIPLHNRLKRQLHRDIAALQDIVVENVYSLEENAVLHGGTAIWRCFDGNRFSEDLDFYIKPRKSFREKLGTQLERLGMKVSKYRQTSNAIYSRVEHQNTVVSLEIALRNYSGAVASTYEKVDGTLIDVFTPSANELLKEKLIAYANRKLIRDIYDVYHLSRSIEADKGYEKEISRILQNLPKPADEQNLKNIVLVGAVPSFEQMVQALQRRFRQ